MRFSYDNPQICLRDYHYKIIPILKSPNPTHCQSENDYIEISFIQILELVLS